MSEKALLVASCMFAALAGTYASNANAFLFSSGDDDAMRCEILMDKKSNMIRLQGVVHSNEDIEGQYRITVKASGWGGSSNISQGGMFFASEDQPAALGMVMLSAGKTYDVDLEVQASNGTSFECSERFANTI